MGRNCQNALSSKRLLVKVKTVLIKPYLFFSTCLWNLSPSWNMCNAKWNENTREILPPVLRGQRWGSSLILPELLLTLHSTLFNLMIVQHCTMWKTIVLNCVSSKNCKRAFIVYRKLGKQPKDGPAVWFKHFRSCIPVLAKKVENIGIMDLKKNMTFWKKTSSVLWHATVLQCPVKFWIIS